MWWKISLIFFAVSCNKSSGPEEVFKQFIGEGQSNPSRSDMINLASGRMKDYLETMSDDDFEKGIKKDFAQKANIKIKNKICDSSKCSITYTSSYAASENGAKSYDIESKKVVYMNKVDNKWKVEDVSNIKSYYEGREIK